MYLKIRRISKTFLILFLGMIMGVSAFAQAQKTIKGTVKDATGEPIIGASVIVQGTTTGAATDVDGNFTLQAPSNGTLVVSYIGYQSQTVAIANRTSIKIVLKEDRALLDEVVVIGYGSVRKSDATGSVELLTQKDMNKGAIVTADNLITGRMAGVQVVPNGNPGTGSQIRIRGGASLDANNDPLIVVDGLPLKDASITQINPSDIETFSVLKDASATAIYGSRASNGVILITTKKGGQGKWNFSADLQGSVMTLPWKVQSLSQADFIDAVKALGPASEEKLGYNGTMYNTNWQDQIFKTQMGTNANLSARGKIGDFLPARFTVGYNNTPGLLMTSGYQRGNGSLAFNPTFFDNTLKIELNASGSYEKYNKANEGAIGAAIYFDPTKPVYVNGKRDANAKYLGYYEWGADYGDNNNYAINTLAPRNPVAMLNEVNHTSDVYKLWGNLQFDYSVPYIKGLRAVLNLGLQAEKWNEDSQTNKIASTITAVGGKNTPLGSEWHKKGNNSNQLLDAYLNYNKTFDAFKLDLTGGYSYQKYQVGTEYESGDLKQFEVNPALQQNFKHDKIYTPKVLISYFGRANLSLYDRYLLTLTLRNDHSSMFAPGKRSGIFPAASFAWRISEENLLKESKVLSNLKLRLGWGITGQQDLYGDERVNINRYLPLYGLVTGTDTQYPMGDVYGFPVYPLAYNPNLTWEKTTTYNAGFDYGFMQNRLNGTIDVYYKESRDLLANIQIPAGVNFANEMYMNRGAFSTKGVEFSVNYDIFRNMNKGAFNWSASYNVSFNQLKIIDYDAESSNERVYVSGGGGGIPISIFKMNYAPYTYNVYRQVYNADGTAIEGVFEDLNADGKIDSKDRYLFHKPSPNVTMGLATNLSYKNFDFSMSWRGSFGNYIYNQIAAMNSYRLQLDPSGTYLSNIISNKFAAPDDTKRVSDQWIENGSFIKWDNATLGYSFDKLLKDVNVRAYLSVQNILTLTKANVHDPEVALGGNDAGVVRNLYPRPRTFLLGFNINF